jgi:hypothetical protein
MRTALLLLSVLLTAGCATSADSKMKPSGKFLFSIRITETAFGGVEKEDRGFYFYLQESVNRITGYQMTRGRRTNVISYDASEIRRQIRQIAFEPFNFDAEITKIFNDARHGGGKGDLLIVSDGAEYEIRFVDGPVDYTLKTWNAVSYIDEYALRSPKIAKLKALIDCFALQFGRAKFQLGD